MNTTNPKVDGLLRKAKKWQGEMEELRRIVLDCGLAEDVKWRHPCYTVQNKNVVIINGFKEYCSLLFMKGVLLKDPAGILVSPGENSQVGRLIKFTSTPEILAMEPTLKAYIQEATEVEKSGRKVTLKKISDRKIPDELKKKLDEMPALKTAFHALTPGRQRRYLLYFSGAKQSTTRESRVEKCMPRILKGKGMDD